MARDTLVNNYNTRRSLGRPITYAEVQDRANDHYMWSECSPWSIVRPAQRVIENLIANPSMEFSIQGWAANGANAVISRQSGDAVSGHWAGRIEQNDFSGEATVRYTGTGLGGLITINEDERVFFTVWVRAPAATTIHIDMEYTARQAGQTYSMAQAPAEKQGTGDWVQLQASFTWNGASNPVQPTIDLTPRIVVTQNNEIAPFEFDWDAAMVTEGFPTTTFFDGDSSGAEWTGQARASTSISSTFSRNIGELVDVADIGVDLYADQGWGMPPVEDITTSFALGIAGAHFQRQRVLPRTITLSGVIQGCCNIAEVAQKRRVLQRRLLGNFAAICNEGFTLSYQPVSPCCGALARRLELRQCHYGGGLEGNKNNLHFERVAMQFTSYDPYWIDPIERTLQLQPSVQTSLTLDSTAPVYPLIEFTRFAGLGATVNPGGTFINDTTNQLIVINDNPFNDMGDGASIIIDTDPRNLSAVRTDTLEDVTYIIDHAASTLGAPLLYPGLQVMRYVDAGQTNVQASPILRWNERYLSADDITSTSNCSVCGC